MTQTGFSFKQSAFSPDGAIHCDREVDTIDLWDFPPVEKVYALKGKNSPIHTRESRCFLLPMLYISPAVYDNGTIGFGTPNWEFTIYVVRDPSGELRVSIISSEELCGVPNGGDKNHIRVWNLVSPIRNHIGSREVLN